MTKQEAIEQFYELLLDPDPASMDVALDIAEANGLKLAELGHAMALNSPTNLRGAAAGWAEVGTSRGFASTGEFRLSPSEEPGSPEYMAVGWIVWGDESAARAEWVRRYHAHRYSFEVQIDYRGAELLEGAGGVRGKFVSSQPPSRRRDLQELPSLIKGADTKAVAERKAVELAWQIAKLLKEAVRSHSDPLDVIIWLHEDKRLEWTDAKRRRYPPPPRAVVNPRAAGDLRRADDEVALLPEAQRALEQELEGNLEENPRPHRNPEMTREEAQRAFDELLRDPDPAAMQIAEDLVLEHKLSLADLGEHAVDIERHVTTIHSGRRTKSTGRFTLSPLYPADAPLYAIEWQVEERPAYVTNAVRTTWSYWIEGFWAARKFQIRSVAFGYYRTFDEARRAAAADSWALAKHMKLLMTAEDLSVGDLPQVEFQLQEVLHSPDATAPELYEHRATRGPKGGRAKQPTYKEAQDAIFSALRRTGWILSPLTMKLPHATSPNGSLRLWFKPQAVHYTLYSRSSEMAGARRHLSSDARSVSYDLDIRKMTPSEFLGYLRDRFPKAFE